jgi:hypothetical protein
MSISAAASEAMLWFMTGQSREGPSKGIVLFRKPTGGWKIRIFNTRIGEWGPTYEIFSWNDVFRIEAHPHPEWMPRWFFHPHAHLDMFGEGIKKLHIPILEAILFYFGLKTIIDEE